MRFGIPKSAVIGMAVFAGAAIAAQGTVYVADEGSDTVSMLDARSAEVVANVPVGREPNGISVAPSGAKP